MTALRLLGVCLLIAAGYGAGLRRLQQLRSRVEALRQLGRMFARVQDEIEYRGLPLGEILELLRCEEGFERLELGACPDLQQLKLPVALSAAQRAALEGALRTLGQRTSQESTRQLAYYQKICASFTEQEELKLCNAEKLYRQLGLCAGALAALLFL